MDVGSAPALVAEAGTEIEAGVAATAMFDILAIIVDDCLECSGVGA